MVNVMNQHTGRTSIPLDGEWRFFLDPADEFSSGKLPEAARFESRIRVPGSWEEQGFGDEPLLQQIDTWTKIREYTGTGWYRLEFEAEAAPENGAARLTLAGVRWASQVWLNGRYAGRESSLSVEHVHDVTGLLVPGRNELLIRVDNRMLLPLADSHIHTRHTATEWGGITGGAVLELLPPLRIRGVRVTPDLAGRAFRCLVETDGDPGAVAGCRVIARFTAPSGETFEASADCQGTGTQVVCPLGEFPAYWSDVSPLLYEAEFALARGGATEDRVRQRAGFREFRAEGQRLLLNGAPVFLRGYADCCIFPLTGYPSWDKEHYARQFRIAKSYGFNHVRLHSWTAPAPFWEAADEAGMLVQAELPHWSALYQPRSAVPDGEVDAFLEAELIRIYDRLNAHPSFVLFSMGNELVEDDGNVRLNEWVRLAKERDPSRLATDNTGFGQLPEQDRAGDFYIHSFNWHKPLKTEEIAKPATDRDFSAVTRLTDKPVLGHEHAQFSMYVRPQEREKYTGVLRPTWLETTEETLRRKGLDARVDEFIAASGVHQVRSLKEALERVRRTPGAAGFQLLDIRDFPGQGHATTGILDVFWDDKGFADPETFAGFNGPTSLLMECVTRTFYAGETLSARLLVSHYGEALPLTGRVGWSLKSGGEVLGEGSFPLSGQTRGSVEAAGTVRVALPDSGACSLVLEAWLEEEGGRGAIRNEWSFWAFDRVRPDPSYASVWTSAASLKLAFYGIRSEPGPSFDAAASIRRGLRLAVVDRLTTPVLQYLANGGRVWLMAGESEIADAVVTKYLPVFWNYLMFSEQAGGTMGTVIRPHPALGAFPHDGNSDWHWYHLFNGAPAVCLDAVPEIEPIVEPVDNFNRAKRLAYAFEANVGRGRLLVTTLNFRAADDLKKPETAFLLRQFLDYARSEAFRPQGSMTLGQVLGLFRLRGIHSFL
ncbi:glycoside hydrolase family 2 protein [Cohnella caldifontis]|uniref:glycoside hydrolase family 2 protein n=1 Tax=Cohnella caldifontis TaxID=3027471 RepID=UPI0023EB43B7|nr:sugar-binding domain-containing protein [Cohnella sp. YIM B05605]